MKPDTLEIQFIGNSAFRISDGESTLLTDFPYRSGSFGYMKYRMEDARANGDALSLITHRHRDHWNRKLFKGMNHAIIAPPRVLRWLKPDHAIPFEKVMAYKDIRVEAFKTPHSFSPEHHSYLITWHGLRIYVPGDVESPAHLLGMQGLDVVFITTALVYILARQTVSLDAKRLILCHHRPKEQPPPFQDYVRMEQGERVYIPFGTGCSR